MRRQDRKESLPVTEELAVEPHERARLLGPGGINLRRLYVETGVQLSALDERRFSVFAPNAGALAEARARLAGWLSAERAPDLEFGAVYAARVVELRDCGVMVALHAALPPALLHNSQLDHRKVRSVASCRLVSPRVAGAAWCSVVMVVRVRRCSTRRRWGWRWAQRST